ncbi:MAG: histidine--tRNA ligase [Candidatus Omnitrophota bacterium]|jgi:histidyl-tRNA synthetase|nr:MAG: histidine--tRNA ligase [Candidatus Omnitrophota bacterium]
MENTGSVRENLVDPITLKGFRDYLPDDMISRNQVVEKIRLVYEKYGFLPIDTPILEYLVTLIGTAGEETNKQMFRLESPEREPIAMRFDLTVPFARIIAQYPEKIKMPFRRYHIGPVFRADKPGPGRYRQFTQFDIDAAGSESVAVDAEVVAAMCEALRSLGLKNCEDSDAASPEYQVRINHRRLVDAMLEGCGIDDPATHKHILRVIDKLSKVGLDNIEKELGEGRVDESGDKIPGVGLENSVIRRILEFISIEGKTREEVLTVLEEKLPDTELSRAALAEMKELRACLDHLGVGETEAVFDPTLTRGLDYYTGPVFEAFLPFAPEFGSVMGGGRYDQLVERFLDEKIPATGASIGLDRLISALIATGKIKTISTTTKVIILTMQDVPKTELLSVARELRSVNIPTEIFLGNPKTGMRDQLSYANFKEIPIAVIIGPDELKMGKASIKNLIVGKEKRSDIEDRIAYVKAGKTGQVTVERNALISTIRDMLKD